MKGFLSACLCVVLLANTAMAQNEAKTTKKPGGEKGQPKLETLKAKVSYGVGLNIGRNLAQNDFEFETALLFRGIQDALTKKKNFLLTEDEIRAAFEAFQLEMQAKAKAKAEQYIKEGIAFLAKNKKRKGVTTLKSGLQYEVIKAGKGPIPKATDRVKVHYHGTLIDGTVFDSSVERDEPSTFGVTGVIKGWIEALQLMKVGDKWKLFVPSDLAYGERRKGRKIAPNSVLIFEVELLGIEKK